MVREKLEKLDTKQLRKYITEHNKVVRKYIGEEIKQARVEYNQELKVKRREMRAARTLNPKGKKKPELIDLIMSEPLLVKRLKSELRVPFENLEKKRETVKQIKKQKDIAKQQESKQKKDSVTFKPNLIDIEKRKSDPRIQEIIYDDEETNIYIELTLTGKKDLLIEFQYSQFNKDKPRAPKGSTRKILCKLIDNLLEKNVLSKTATVSLITGDIGGTEGQKHDVTKLKKMYEEMGFKAQRDKDSKDQMYEMSIKKFFEWCQKTYTDEFFRLAEKKKPKVIKIKKKPKVPKITITEAEEEPDVGGAAEPKSRLGPIPKPNVKIRVAPKKKPEPQQEDEEEEEEEKYDRKKVKVIKEIKTNKAGWLDYLELLADGEDDMGLYSPSIQQRYYKGLITRESNFIKRVKKNEKGKGTAKEQKERTVKNNNILNIVREEIRNQPNIRKLFDELNPEIMKRLKKKVKEDDEKEAKEKKEKQSEQDKFILGNIKFYEDELKEVKKRKQNPSTEAMIEELEERIADEKAKLSKNKKRSK